MSILMGNNRAKWLADDFSPGEEPAPSRKPPRRSFAGLYLVFSLVVMAGSLGFAGGFFYGAKAQREAPKGSSPAPSLKMSRR